MTKTAQTALLLVLAAVCCQAQQTAPQYTNQGEMLFPKDYRQWDFLSSSVGMNYPEEGPGGQAMFGNIFVQRSAHQYFEKTGTWPDKTVLLMEVRGVGHSTEGDSFLNKDAQFQTDVMAYEAHVKDSSRGGWAFYSIRKDATSGKAFDKTAKCFSCHADHGAVDTTFVQYYPTLIAAAKKHGTFQETIHH